MHFRNENANVFIYPETTIAMAPLTQSFAKTEKKQRARGLCRVLSVALGPSAHYLKRSLVFICRAGDVAPSSTFPSRAVYIRAPVWLYKTRRLKEGGSEAERDADREGRR